MLAPQCTLNDCRRGA